MRIVSWNMNHSGHRRSHGEAWEFLRGLDPDIALLQEAVVPEEPFGYEVESIKPWGHLPWTSAILSRVGRLEKTLEDPTRGAVVVADCPDSPLGAITLASIHAKVIDHRVIPSLRETLEKVRSKLGPRFVIGGDLNTARSAGAAWPKNGHQGFWAEIDTSAFREALPLDGSERQSYWGKWLTNKPPTIGNSLQDDHVFVDSETFRRLAECRIWDTKHVRSLSDHGPVVVDLSTRRRKQNQVRLEVDGSPPSKSGSPSVFSPRSSYRSRVEALLRAAKAETDRGFPGFGGLSLRLDVVLFLGPGEGEAWDATNFLGGISDVLELKRTRLIAHPGSLDHLADLIDVGLYRDDRQIKQVSYREVSSAGPTRYIVTLTAL